MQCHECGHSNIAGSLFCERCGADLESPAQAAHTAQAAQAAAAAAASAAAAAAAAAAVAAQPAAQTKPAVAEAPAQEITPTPAAAPAAQPADTLEPVLQLVDCPHCGHENPTEFLLCEACGQPLRDTPLAKPAPVPVPVAASLPADDLPQRRLETPDALEKRATAGEPVPTPGPATASTGNTPGQLVTGPQRGKVKLMVEQGMVLGKQFLLATDQVLVGREDASERLFPDIDLTGLDEGYVHRKHAMLTFEGSFLFVTHLGGHNRTYVNNRPIADHLPHPLNIGDTVRFGKVVLRVVEV